MVCLYIFNIKDILSQHKSLKEVSILLKFETIKLHKYLHECSIICFNPNSQETWDATRLKQQTGSIVRATQPEGSFQVRVRDPGGRKQKLLGKAQSPMS